MSNLLVPSNISTSNLAFVTVDLEVLKDFTVFPGVISCVEELEVKSSGNKRFNLYKSPITLTSNPRNQTQVLGYHLLQMEVFQIEI